MDDSAELTVPQKLAAALRANSARVLDLFRQLDENDDGVVSRQEFVDAFAVENNLLQGSDVSARHAAELFDTWDADGSGSIEFKELERILRRRAVSHASPLTSARSSKTSARASKKVMPKPDQAQGENDERKERETLPPV